jgi:hypothetical protein
MPEEIGKEAPPLSGVKCVVNTCQYYDNYNQCTAPKIEILPQNASSSQETNCGTFIYQQGPST